MIEQFKARGLKIPFGGTDCHLINIDCTSIKGADGATLSGDMASRILDVAGLVINPATPSRATNPPLTRAGFASGRRGLRNAALTRKNPVN